MCSATSLQITDEVGGYLLVAMTFLSMSVAEAHGAFHRVELVQVRLSRKAQMISQIVFDLMSLGASALVTWQLDAACAELVARRRRRADAVADAALAAAGLDGDRHGAACASRWSRTIARQGEGSAREQLES